MADAVRGVEHAVEGALNVPEFHRGSLCDEVIYQLFPFARGQIKDICGDPLFGFRQRPGHDLC